MTTFREYALSIRLPKPQLSTSWITKELLAWTGLGVSIALGIGFIPFSPWFMLLWISIPPLAIYANYCSKKESGELD